MQSKSITLCVAIIMVGIRFACAQTWEPLQLPAHHILQADSIPGTGRVMYVSIKNTAQAPVTLIPQYNPWHPGQENIHHNKHSVIAWLLSHVNATDSFEMRKQLLIAALALTKNGTKSATVRIFSALACNNPDSAFARKYAPTGELCAEYHDHCNDEVTFVESILTGTGMFPPNSFGSNTLKWHTTGSWFVYAPGDTVPNDTIAFDASANQPFSLISDLRGLHGLASPIRLNQHPELITANQIYSYLNNDNVRVYLGNDSSVQNYQLTYSIAAPTVKPFAYTGLSTYNFENKIILCAGCTLNWMDTIKYLIDTTQRQNSEIWNQTLQQAFNDAVIAVRTGDSTYNDSVSAEFYKAYGTILNLPTSTAQQIFLADQAVIYDTSSSWSPPKMMTVPTLSVLFPMATDTMLAGTDFYFPYLLQREEIADMDDDTFTKSVQLWAGNLRTAPIISSYKNIVYPISPSLVVPPHKGATVYLAYSPTDLDFYRGAKFLVSDLSAIEINSSPDTITSTITTAITSSAPVGTCVAYPNPSQGVFHIQCRPPAPITVTDITGRAIAAGFEKRGDEITIILHAPPGIYYARTGTITTRLMVMN